jgi:acyl-CoA thioesterase-1
MLQNISIRSRFFVLATVAILLCGSTSGCGDSKSSAKSSQPPPPRQTSAAAAHTHRIVVLGDSLAAGLGLAEADAFPAILETELRNEGFDVEIVNGGVSGDTTAGGLSRLAWVLQEPADILVVELGGNDALRGQQLENTGRNLREIVRRGRDRGSEVILLGMDVPSNYGPEYSSAFAELFPLVADEEGATLVPGFVREIGSDPSLLQPDGLHPTAKGQRRLAMVLKPFVMRALDPDGSTTR